MLYDSVSAGIANPPKSRRTQLISVFTGCECSALLSLDGAMLTTKRKFIVKINARYRPFPYVFPVF
jgi:hypothetical protein